MARNTKTPAPRAREPQSRAARAGAKHATDAGSAVGAKLRVRREEFGMTRAQLARRIGVTDRQVQRYEKGASRISSSCLVRIARVLEVPVSYFFDRSAGEPEIAIGSLLATPGAAALVRAFAAITDKRQRHALIDLARAFAGQSPLKRRDVDQ